MSLRRPRLTRRSLLVFLAWVVVCGAAVAAMDAFAQEASWYCRQIQVVDPRFYAMQLEGADLDSPTCLQFGPDGRLYVSQGDGVIKIFTVASKPDGGYEVRGSETVPLVKEIPNHDDDGSLNPAVSKRLTTGLLVAGTAERPVIYVSSSDPRIEHPQTDTNSGVISRLTLGDDGWRREDLIRGLPRSRSNHATNGLHLDVERSLLYAAQGGNTNSGAPSSAFHRLPEYALSGAILSIDLPRLPPPPYDLPTLDDEDRPGNPDWSDPFGGNGGKNQAILSAEGPVQLYATGLRNVYDLVWTSKGFYLFDNGANEGFGGPPVISAADGKATNEVVDGGPYYPNTMHHVPRAGYYGGHPNPTRANKQITFNATMPQSPVAFETQSDARFLVPGTENGALMSFAASTNGITVYDYPELGPDGESTLLTVGLDRTAYLLTLDSSGDQVLKQVRILKGGGAMFLDVVAHSSGDPYPGSIWIADYGTGSIVILEPGANADLLTRLGSLVGLGQQSACEALRSARLQYQELRQNLRTSASPN